MTEEITRNSSKLDPSIDGTFVSEDSQKIAAQQIVLETSNALKKTSEADKAEVYEDLSFPVKNVGKSI